MMDRTGSNNGGVFSGTARIVCALRELFSRNGVCSEARMHISALSSARAT